MEFFHNSLVFFRYNAVQKSLATLYFFIYRIQTSL